jgi:hypothetical protein
VTRAALALLAALSFSVHAQPQPPCNGVRTWSSTDWTPPACLSWPAGGFRLLYPLSSTGSDASALAGSSEQSYVNRATALYRHFTGQKQ